MQHSIRAVGIVLLLSVTSTYTDALLTTRTTRTALRLSSEVVSEQSPSTSGQSPSIPNLTIEKFEKPPRLIPEDPSLIPTLYQYDHCPFCVRVRLALGFKNIKHNLVFMANDDVHTPTAMVGKKVAPIMVRGGRQKMY